MIYFVRSQATGLIKIGFSENPEKRFKQLCLANGTDLEMLRVCSGDIAKEKSIHKELAIHRISGEWFTPHRDVIAKMKSMRRIQFTINWMDPKTIDCAVITAACKITAQAVQQWFRIPRKHVMAVEKATGISRYDLRPDIFKKGKH